MQLLIKQRIFSWTDTYDVYDSAGNAVYFVKAEFFSLGHQIHVYEKSTGRELGCVHQRLFSLLPSFEIEINGQTVGSVEQQFSLFVPRYAVDFRGWDVEGDLLGWDYSVYERQRPVVSISREIFAWGDTYVLSFANPADELPGLLLVIAIDAANCSRRK